MLLFQSKRDEATYSTTQTSIRSTKQIFYSYSVHTTSRSGKIPLGAYIPFTLWTFDNIFQPPKWFYQTLLVCLPKSYQQMFAGGRGSREHYKLGITTACCLVHECLCKCSSVLLKFWELSLEHEPSHPNSYSY